MPASAKELFDGLRGPESIRPRATTRGRLKPVHDGDYRPWPGRGGDDASIRAWDPYSCCDVCGDFEAKQSELLAGVATRVRNLASEYAVANGFDAILMFETTPLVDVTDSAVITDTLIQIYNERYPVN